MPVLFVFLPRRRAGRPRRCEEGPPDPATGVAKVAAVGFQSAVTRQGKGWLWCAHTSEARVKDYACPFGAFTSEARVKDYACPFGAFGVFWCCLSGPCCDGTPKWDLNQRDCPQNQRGTYQWSDCHGRRPNQKR
jgi:hypothetical protein